MFALYDRLSRTLNASSDVLLPTLARFTFMATLFFYFIKSAETKWEGTPFSPSLGGYAQIFPKAMEAVGYDASQLTTFHWAVVVSGTLAEYILPVLIMIGLLTRFAALGMIGFVVVQSLTDLFGHGGKDHVETFGKWFDNLPDSAILDQRLFWVVVFVTLVLKGAGPLSVDYLLSKGRSA